MSADRVRKQLASLIPLIYGIFLFSLLIVPVGLFLALESVCAAQASAVDEVVDAEIVTTENGMLKVLTNKGHAQEKIVELSVSSLLTGEGTPVVAESLKPGSRLQMRVKRNDFQTEFNRILLRINIISVAVSLLGLFVPSLLPLFQFERDRHFYERLGINRFRYYANNGGMIRSVVASLEPESLTHFRRSTLQTHKQFYDFGERMHWNWLFGTLPALIWAIGLSKHGWVVLFCVMNLLINIYPIMLERYMRARVEAVERHPSYKAFATQA